MSKNWLLVLAVVGAVAAVGGGVWYQVSRNRPAAQPATGSGVGNVAPVATPTPESSASEGAQMQPATGQVKEFVVTGSKFKFSPATLQVKKGDTVRIVFKNSEGIHDFTLTAFAVATNQIGEGEEEEVEFVADQAGKFEYYCSVGNHKEQGMKGQLVVE